MAVDCLFCDNPAGSKEHLWAKWIHKRKDFGPLSIKMGNAHEWIAKNPERKIATVCGECNNGWMSVLENKHIPLIGSMFQDLSVPLDVEQQTSLSVWAVKTAMVLDSVKDQTTNPLFYEKDECAALRLHHTIPDHCRIWIGRCSGKYLGAFGTDLGVVFPDAGKIGVGCATTIVVGHLAIQVLALHVYTQHADKNIDNLTPLPGDWGNLLVQIWPIGPHSIMWPPKVTFTNSGQHSIAHLMSRWKLGQDVGK